MHRKILWNLIMVQSLVSLPANELTNAVLTGHLLGALNRTIFEHSSGKIADHVSTQGQAIPLRCRAVSPTFYTPVNLTIKI